MCGCPPPSYFFPLCLSPSHLILSFHLLSLHPYISPLTVPLRCCQPWHLPFKCQQTHAICLYLSTKYRCVCMHTQHLRVCAPSSMCIHVLVCPFLCMCVRFNSKWWGSQQPKQALAQRGSTHYLSNRLRERKTERDRGREGGGGSQRLSFNSGSNNSFFNNGRIGYWLPLEVSWGKPSPSLQVYSVAWLIGEWQVKDSFACVIYSSSLLLHTSVKMTLIQLWLSW